MSYTKENGLGPTKRLYNCGSASCDMIGTNHRSDNTLLLTKPLRYTCINLCILSIYVFKRAFHRSSSWTGGHTKVEFFKQAFEKGFLGTALDLDKASASSLDSAGRCCNLYCQRRTIFLQAISLAMQFILGEVELNPRETLSAPRLSPLIKAPVVSKILEKVTALKKSVKNSNEV